MEVEFFTKDCEKYPFGIDDIVRLANYRNELDKLMLSMGKDKQRLRGRLILESKTITSFINQNKNR